LFVFKPRVRLGQKTETRTKYQIHTEFTMLNSRYVGSLHRTILRILHNKKIKLFDSEIPDRILEFTLIRIIRIRFPRLIMSFMHYQNSTTYFHRVCIQSGIVRKKLGFEARCYIIVIYLNVGTLIIIDAINVKIQLSPWLTSSF
jgi:hypothetical protein